MMRLLFCSCFVLLVFLMSGAVSDAQADSATRSVLIIGASESGTETAVIRRVFGKSAFALNYKSVPTSEFNGSDSRALELGRAAGVTVVVVATMRVHEQGRLRSTPLQGSTSEMNIQIWDVSRSQRVFGKVVRHAGYGTKASDATQMATQRVLKKVSRTVEAVIARHWPTGSLLTGTQVLSLGIRGATSWRAVASILRTLAATPGVQYIHALDIRNGRIRLQLASQQSVTSVVASLRRARIHEGKILVNNRELAITCVLQMNEPIEKDRPNNG